MPLQLYDKEKILNECLRVFAQRGYENTSVAMLAEAAGVSKALIFHHFNSKKELYFCILDQCMEKGKEMLGIDNLLLAQDFFEARERFTILKFEYFKKNSDIYKVGMEAFYSTPAELKDEIEKKYGVMIAAREKLWEQLFERVILREGIDRKQALQLVSLTLDHFENKYLSDLGDNEIKDDIYFRRFLDERNSFLSMIRFGIQA